MSKVYSGSPVPRQYVFIMADGAFVVQWDETRVQDLLTGKYRLFDRDGFGHPITDYELNQLKAAGRVEHFSRHYVWLYALPEGKRFDIELKTMQRMRHRVRTYYLNTTLPKSELESVGVLLHTLGLADELSVQERGGLVAVLGKKGAPFRHFTEAEGVQRRLVSRAPDVFKETAVAFSESSHSENPHPQDEHGMEPDDLATVIASQTDTSVTQGKCVVLVIRTAADRTAINDLCREMGMSVRMAETGAAGLQLLEDAPPHLLIMDIELADMHGWEMLGKVKEIASLRELPIIVMAEPTSSPNQQSFALSVAKVDVYLVKPVSMAKLRQNIWMALKERTR
ncbi:MAG: response regulator [Chloroflexi bacterium]|nr:response regulator [Chloroflexota bacterium]